jgi:serine/threonine protein kinase
MIRFVGGQPQVILIDFGLSKLIGPPMRQQVQPAFEGNIVFCSRNQMKFIKTSGTDDIESLFFLLCFMLNQCKVPIPGFDEIADSKTLSLKDQYLQIRKLKEAYSLHYMS